MANLPQSCYGTASPGSCDVFVLQKYAIDISEQDAEDVMAAANGAIVKVLQTVHDYVHEDPSAQQADAGSMQPVVYDPATASAQAAMQPPGYDYPPMQYSMQQAVQASQQEFQYHPDQHLHPYPQQQVAAYPSQIPAAQMQFMQSPYGHNIGRPMQGYPEDTPYGALPNVQAPVMLPMAQHQQWQQPHAELQPFSHQQPYAVGYTQDMAAAAAAGVSQGAQYGADSGGQSLNAAAARGHTAASTSAPSIEYDRRPRPVDYKPYTQQDYASRNYDAKNQAEYWQLGTLGPQIDDEDLQVPPPCRIAYTLHKALLHSLPANGRIL